MRRLFGVLLGAVTSFGCSASEFRCEEDGQCGDDRLCEPTGFCSEADPSCDSGRRYSSLSGSLSDECVSLGESTTDEADTGTVSPTSGPSTTTTNPLSSSTSTDSSGGSSSTTDPIPTSTEESGTPALEFIDEQRADFEAGTMIDTEWNEGLTLPGGGSSGQFRSRVFDAGGDATWTALEWLPAAPYTKALPNDGASERSYSTGNADLSGNVLLLHFDEDVVLSPSDPVLDTSPLALPAAADGMVPLVPTQGIFGAAMSIASSGFVTIPTVDTSAFQFGTEGYTWSMWARTDSSCSEGQGNATNQVYLGIEDPGKLDSSHLWLGCKNPSTAQCPDGSAGGHAGGTHRPHLATGQNGSVCADSELVGTGWHHIGLVRDPVEQVISLWFDGVQADSQPLDDLSPVVFQTSPPFTVGSLSGAYFSEFDVDEVAIFARPFTSNEVTDLYRRGALRLGVRVRTCVEADCSDDPPFVGADGSEPFVDRSVEPGEAVELTDLGPARYFQYEVVLEGAAQLPLQAAPVLQRVTVQAIP